MQKNEQNVEIIENNDEVYENEQKYALTSDGKEQLEKHLKNGGKVRGGIIEDFRTVDFEDNRKDKTIFEEIKNAIDVRQKDNFYFEMPKFSFVGEKRERFIELLGNGKQYACIKNGNILKINELYENDNNFEGNRALKERTMISFINELPFDYLVYDNKKKGKGKDKIPLTARQIKNRKNKLIDIFKSEKYDFFLKVIYINLLCEINKLQFCFGYVYCFEGLKDGIFDIGQSRFDKEYYLNRYFEHTSYLKGKKSTCSSRYLLDTNGYNHLYSVLEITRGYYASKKEAENTLQKREGFFFSEYKKLGCTLINKKGSGETVKNKKEKEYKDCEICGKPVDQTNTSINSHNKSQFHQRALEVLIKKKQEEIKKKQEEIFLLEEEYEEVVDLDTEEF